MKAGMTNICWCVHTRRSVPLVLAAMCIAMFAAPYSGAHAQVRCSAFDAYKKEGSELWQEGSRLEQILRQRASDAASKAKSCEEARAFERRVETYIAKESKVHGDCLLREGISIMSVGGNEDAKPYAARMLNDYCGEPKSASERGITEQSGDSSWSYRGKLIIPVGLILVLLAFGLRALRSR